MAFLLPQFYCRFTIFPAQFRTNKGVDKLTFAFFCATIIISEQVILNGKGFSFELLEGEWVVGGEVLITDHRTR